MSSRGLSVVITVRGDEPKLADTIENVRQRAGCPVEVVVVYDGTEHDSSIDADQILAHRQARGIGPSRHKGVEKARYSVVILIDAHMNFEQDFGKVILDHYKKKMNQKDVTCGRCVPSMLDLSPMTGPDGEPEHGYTAARFSLHSEETAGEHWCLSGKWHNQEVNSPIGCVFGASYAFTKSWYKKIGEPLQLLRGWWGDEEYLSIASWLAGGRCYLLDYWASHLFRDNPSFSWTREDMIHPSVNRSRLIDLFPADPELKKDLLAWSALSLRTADGDYIRAYEADRTRPEVIAAKELWSTWSGRVKGFLEKWVDTDAEPLEKRQQQREDKRPWKTTAGFIPNKIPVNTTQKAPLVQQRKMIQCPNCGHRNSFRVKSTQTVGGEKRRYGRCINAACKNNAVMIDRGSDQVIYWGRDASHI